MRTRWSWWVGLLVCGLLPAGPAGAQVVETVGTRALGMGGAFVAVANDSSATWWNPAGLASGPFLDMSIAWTAVGQDQALPGWRTSGSSFAMATPPFGLGYYRLQLANASALEAGEAGGAEAFLRSLPVTQMSVTVVQTIVSGLHAGANLKYLRGTLRSEWREVPGAVPGGEVPAEGVAALFARTGDLEGGRTQHRFDLDAGLIAVYGPVRAGAVIRNLRRPTFGGAVPLSRQVRVGAAFSGAQIDVVPLTVSVDADLRTYETVTGPRRVVAAGAEQWLFDGRLGVRGGARFNRVGGRERAATAGASYALRTGMYVEGHVVRGGSADEQGWGLGARVSF